MYINQPFVVYGGMQSEFVREFRENEFADTNSFREHVYPLLRLRTKWLNYVQTGSQPFFDEADVDKHSALKTKVQWLQNIPVSVPHWSVIYANALSAYTNRLTEPFTATLRRYAALINETLEYVPCFCNYNEGITNWMKELDKLSKEKSLQTFTLEDLKKVLPFKKENLVQMDSLLTPRTLADGDSWNSVLQTELLRRFFGSTLETCSGFLLPVVCRTTDYPGFIWLNKNPSKNDNMNHLLSEFLRNYKKLDRSNAPTMDPGPTNLDFYCDYRDDVDLQVQIIEKFQESHERFVGIFNLRQAHYVTVCLEKKTKSSSVLIPTVFDSLLRAPKKFATEDYLISICMLYEVRRSNDPDEYTLEFGNDLTRQPAYFLQPSSWECGYCALHTASLLTRHSAAELINAKRVHSAKTREMIAAYRLVVAFESLNGLASGFDTDFPKEKTTPTKSFE